jgi:hypothetical protein
MFFSTAANTPSSAVRLRRTGSSPPRRKGGKRERSDNSWKLAQFASKFFPLSRFPAFRFSPRKCPPAPGASLRFAPGLSPHRAFSAKSPSTSQSILENPCPFASMFSLRISGTRISDFKGGCPTPPCENRAMNDNVIMVGGGGGGRNDAP